MHMLKRTCPDSVDVHPAMAGAAADDTGRLLRDSAEPYLADNHRRSRLRHLDGASGAILDSMWREMAGFGWLALTLPEAAGGSGLDIRCAMPLCKLFGSLLVPEPLVACGLMPAALLAQCPGSPTRSECEAPLVSGAGCLTIAWQESAGQIEPATTARLDAQLRLSGQKMYVPLSFLNSILLVDAVWDGEPVIVAVATDAAGIRLSRQHMGDGGYSATVTFESTQIIRTPLARGDTAVLALRRALYEGTLGICGALVGLAEGALALTLDYLRTRTQFGRPIGAFQVLQHRAVDFHIGLQLAEASLQEALRLAGADDGNSTAALSAAKARCSKTALSVTKGATQMFGALGFTEDADIGLYLRTALHWSAWLGNETAHRKRYGRLLREAVS